MAAAAGMLFGSLLVFALGKIGIPATLPGGDTPDVVRPHLDLLDVLRLSSMTVAVEVRSSPGTGGS